jgi:hypothetical protein
MYYSLIQHMHCNNILVSERFALREATSTEDEAHKLSVSVLKSIKQRINVG